MSDWFVWVDKAQRHLEFLGSRPKNERNLTAGVQVVKQQQRGLAMRLQAALQAALWVVLCAALGGCFTQNFAEGFYIEDSASGRWQAYNKWRTADAEPMQFLRLRLVQFDTEVAGLVEIFRLSEHSTFTSQPIDIEGSRPDRFCTRLDWATSRDERLVLQFWDAHSRRWQIDATYEDDTLVGHLSRVTALGEVLSSNDAASRALLWTEDQLYTQDQTLQSGYPQLSLTRESEQVDNQFLQCPDYQTPRQPLTVRLPAAPPPHARLALLLTRPERALSGDGVGGVTFEEFASITLDDIDLVNNQRTVLMRDIPASSFVRSGVAVGTFIAYQDLPDADGFYNGRWDTAGESPEPVWAAARQQVVIFHEDAVSRPLVALSASGQPLGTCDHGDEGTCLFGTSHAPGWTVYEYAATSERLADQNGVWMISRLPAAGEDAIDLRSVEPQCSTCSPSQTSEARPGCDDPPMCKPIFPLLFL
jgi:hypothetical protein